MSRARRDARAPRSTSSFASLLLLAAVAAAAVPQSPDVTFTRDIAPVMYAACATCHREGGPAPFSLITYDQVRVHATQIADVTRRRFMPPWKAEPESGDFVGQRRLSAREIEQIQPREHPKAGRAICRAGPSGRTDGFSARPI
jgi:hypothetical protein